MAKYNATNNTQSITNLAVQRARYRLEAWGDVPPEQIVDFNFAERNRYGRMDLDRNAIVPLPQYLKTVSFYAPDQATSLMMNFVADAFDDMRDRMVKACRLGIIDATHPFLNSLEIFRAYTSPVKLYRDYMLFIISKYNNEYLPSIEDHTVVLDFDAYWQNMLNFCKLMGTGFPITFTGWHRSKHSSIFTSGLVIDIAGLPIDDDRPKYDMFISANEWNYYSNAAKYHGFSISHNAPWLLVADLRSPAMMEYMQARGFSNPTQLFDSQYQTVIDFELETLKSILVESYNSYVRGNPYHKKTVICADRTLKTKIVNRETTTTINANQRLKPSTFHVFYAQIRNIEEGSPLKKSDLARVIAKLKYFHKTLGPARAMAYINEQYRSLYKFKPGTTYDHKQRTKARREMEQAEATAEDRIESLRSPDAIPVALPDPTMGSY